MVLLVASTNRGKVREIRAILDGAGVDIHTLADYPAVRPPAETGRTFAENARLKARYYAAAFGQLTVAEDSGLEIDALGGQPGVESARFGGDATSYPEKFELIYAAGGAQSPARFTCALALALARGADVIFESRGTVEGLIADEPKGEGGFGYDPIFFYPPFRCTLAEAGDRKSEISHRAEAFRKLRDYLAAQVF
jgi:XTP/dITP diphosphohydrolase